MAKNKQQKKKERERRVAQKKHVAAQKKRAREKAAEESPKSAPVKTMTRTKTGLKADYVPTNRKSPFTQRRGDG